MQYKITRIYIIDAGSKLEARDMLKENPDKYLDWESFPREITDGGWKASVKKQLTGK